MERTLEQPLNQQDLKELDDALKKSNTLIAALDRAKSAGVDIGDQREQAMAQRKKIQSLINAYGTGR